MQNDILAMSHACRAICMLSPLDVALTLQVARARNTTRLKCCACHATWTWTRPKCCTCHENGRHLLKRCKSIAPVTQNDFRHHVQARENVTTCHACHAKRHWTCLYTFENYRFCSFPHRCSDATRKPGNRNETCWNLKTSVSCETSWKFHTL